MTVDTRHALESLICLRERPNVVDRIYLRETRRRNADGTEVAYHALAHNERDPEAGMPKAKIVHNFGRTDLVDREGLRRLVRSISRFLDPADAVAATASGEVSVIDTRPMGAAFLADALWRRIGIADGIAKVAARRRAGASIRSSSSG